MSRCPSGGGSAKTPPRKNSGPGNSFPGVDRFHEPPGARGSPARGPEGTAVIAESQSGEKGGWPILDLPAGGQRVFFPGYAPPLPPERVPQMTLMAAFPAPGPSGG